MTVVPFTDGRIYIAGINVSGHANQGQLEITAQELDISTISSDWDETLIGRKHVELAASGFWEAGTSKPDEAFALLGTSGQVVTLAPDGDYGGVAYTAQAVPAKYTISGTAGDLLKFDLLAKGDTARAVRGTVMHDDVTARTATGNGTSRQLGAVGATQRIYSSLHVLSVSGTNPTLDVVIGSDDATGFLSGTTRITHTQKTAIGAEWMSAAGAITDDWWRVQYSIGGTGSPTMTFVVVLSIV